jgi:hypothetical protein
LKKPSLLVDQMNLFSFAAEVQSEPTTLNSVSGLAEAALSATTSRTLEELSASLFVPSSNGARDSANSIHLVRTEIRVEDNVDAEAIAAAERLTAERRAAERQAKAEQLQREVEAHRAASEERLRGMAGSGDTAGSDGSNPVDETEIEAPAPEILSPEISGFAVQVVATDAAEIASPVAFEALETLDMSASSVTFHKHGKLLLVKANDIYAADVWREISSRLRNDRMTNVQYFASQEEPDSVPSRKHLHELWRWVEEGLEEHPYFRILESYGISANISPSLAGYMTKQKRKVAIRIAAYPCYESSPDDISECIISGMILKCKEELPDRPFRKDKRYLVKGLTELDEVEVYEEELHARALLTESSGVSRFPKAEIQQHFEDSDKFVVKENIRDLYPELIAPVDARLAKLPIGQDGRLFEHSRQDVACEVVKGDYLCSKEMRMGKSREAVAACELIGSKRVAWIGPSSANIDIPTEFRAAGVEDFTEIETIADLAVPTKYHIMTLDFLKKENDPLSKLRRGKKTKTWLRSMGEGKSICDCPHCSQPLERPVPIRSMEGRILRTTWTLYNGYLCRNPYCVWTEVAKPRKPSRKSGKQKIAPTPWHRAGEPAAVTHQGGYVDWQRKQHADCGDHVGRKRFCPKCGLADAAWQPAIYKRIKKNYATVVIDEIQLTMEENSQTSIAALDMRGRHHIGNSGTPMSKNLVDTFPQLMWIFRTKSSYFPFNRATGKSEFRDRFCESIRIQREGTDRSHYKTLPYVRDPVDFWNFSAPLLVRRTRMDPVYRASLERLGLKQPVERTYLMPVRMVAAPGASAVVLAQQVSGGLRRVLQDTRRGGAFSQLSHRDDHDVADEDRRDRARLPQQAWSTGRVRRGKGRSVRHRRQGHRSWFAGPCQDHGGQKDRHHEPVRHDARKACPEVRSSQPSHPALGHCGREEEGAQ